MSVCEYASEPWSHLSNVVLWPRSGKVKHSRCGSPPLSSPPLFFFYIQKKGTFHLCHLLRDTRASACVRVTEKEQEGENQVENMTKAMKGTKQAENQSINQSRRLWAASWRGTCSPASLLMSIKRPQKQNRCPKCEKSCSASPIWCPNMAKNGQDIINQSTKKAW